MCKFGENECYWADKEGNDECLECAISHSRYIDRDRVRCCHLHLLNQLENDCIYCEKGMCFDGPIHCSVTDDDFEKED